MKINVLRLEREREKERKRKGVTTFRVNKSYLLFNIYTCILLSFTRKSTTFIK